jgi:hypothetical protein
MSLFSFLGGAKHTSVVLVDIDSSSVGGAYAHFFPNKPPRIYFTARLPIEMKGGVSSNEDMFRALRTLTDVLVSSGAPVLHKETGSAHIDAVLASVGSPWQQTKIQVKTVGDGEKTFAFTRAVMEETMRSAPVKTPESTDERVSVGNLVIATILNGYETTNPFGKKAKRADLVVLSSTLPKKTIAQIQETLRQAYQTHALTYTAFAPLIYTVFRDMFPLEKDYLVVDFGGETTDIAFVKGSILVDVASIPIGTHIFSHAMHGQHANPGVIDLTRNATLGVRVAEAEVEWATRVADTLKDFTSRHALPRTVFLLAGAENRDFAKRLLDSPTLHALWLSDEALRVIPVLPSQFTSLVETRGSASGDVTLALLALFYKKRLDRS